MLRLKSRKRNVLLPLLCERKKRPSGKTSLSKDAGLCEGVAGLGSGQAVLHVSLVSPCSWCRRLQAEAGTLWVLYITKYFPLIYVEARRGVGGNTYEKPPPTPHKYSSYLQEGIDIFDIFSISCDLPSGAMSRQQAVPGCHVVPCMGGTEGGVEGKGCTCPVEAAGRPGLCDLCDPCVWRDV